MQKCWIIIFMKNLSHDGRWVSAGTAAHVLGVTATQVGNLATAGELSRRGTSGLYRFDIVELVKLRTRRAARGVHRGRPSQVEATRKAAGALRKQLEAYEPNL